MRMNLSASLATLAPVGLAVGDYLDAENAAGGNYPMNFSAHLLARRFKPVAPDCQPLTLVDIRRMAPADFHQLLAANRAFEVMRDGCSSLDMLKDAAKHVQRLLGAPITRNPHRA